jgi:hypothetical protein
MKKILFLFLVCNTAIFAQTNSKIYTETDKIEVEALVKEFNIVLEKYYPNQKLGIAYKMFLSDLNQQKVNPAIIKEENALNSFLQFKKSPTFYKVWMKDKANEARVNVINYQSGFYKSIVDNCKDKSLQKIIDESGKTFVAIPDLNPFMAVEMYVETLKDSDYDLEIIQNLICITFYYDIMEQFSK